MKTHILVLVSLLSSLFGSAFNVYTGRVWTVATSPTTRELNIHLLVPAYSPTDSMKINWDDGNEEYFALTDFDRCDTVARGYEVYYSAVHTFTPGTYQISIMGGTRFPSMFNMSGAGMQPVIYMVQTLIDPNVGANSSPWSDSLELFCDWSTSQMNNATFSVTDADGDSVAWYTITPGANYYYPSTVGGGNFTYSTTAPMSCSWSPVYPGCYNVLFLIEEWHTLPNSNVVLIGYGMREMFLNVDNAIGIQESGTGMTTFYPNPASDEIRFTETVDEVVIMNLQGEIVLSQSNTNALNVSGLAQGVYVMEINGIPARRVVIAR